MSGDYAIRLAPQLSSGWLEAPPTRQILSPQSLTRIWQLEQPITSLAGQQLSIAGLDRTLTDVLVRISWAPERETLVLLKPRHSSLLLQPEGAGAAIHEYFRLGVTHIWGGYDHLLYLLGLLLLIRGFLPLVKVISAFTLAHSLTLALSVLDVVVLPAAPLEVLIALSIVFVANELVRLRRGATSFCQQHPWLIALLFGLLHGFGFAGALRGIGLPPDAVATPLLLFNLGIEAGQLVFVAGVLLLLGALRHVTPDLALRVLRPVPHLIGALAVFWLIGRLAPLA